jgi:hypothetical protein
MEGKCRQLRTLLETISKFKVMRKRTRENKLM